MSNVPHLPVLRLGRSYESLDKLEIKDHRTGEVKAVKPLCVSALVLFLIGSAFSFFLLMPSTVRIGTKKHSMPAMMRQNKWRRRWASNRPVRRIMIAIHQPIKMAILATITKIHPKNGGGISPLPASESGDTMIIAPRIK